jgi:hypothetical protein
MGADRNDIEVGNVRWWSVLVQYCIGDYALCYSRLAFSLMWYCAVFAASVVLIGQDGKSIHSPFCTFHYQKRKPNKI